VTGSGTVLVNNRPAARALDLTMHGAPAGQILLGSQNVIIGGPTVGATLGNPAAGQAAFLDAANGRSTGSQQQSYGNCGVEAARQIINQASLVKVGEDALLESALQNGEADNSSDVTKLGGTRSPERQAMLARYGVQSSLEPPWMTTIVQATAEGKGVLTSHDVSALWGPGYTGGHGAVTTGVEYDANGAVKNVIINDTGTGQGSRRVPAAQYERSLIPGADVNVTNDPIW
jgi:hypothetical protein